MTSPEYQAPTWVNEDDPDFIEGVSPDLGAGYLNQLSGAVEDHGQRLGAVESDVTNLQATALDQADGDARYILQSNANGFAPAEATTTALAGKQPLDDDLTALAGLDSTTAGTVATDGAGWVKKTYAQLRTALGLSTIATSGKLADAADLTTTGAAVGRFYALGVPSAGAYALSAIDPTNPAIAKLHAGLADRLVRPARIVVTGSSTPAGVGASAPPNRFVNRLALATQAAYPSGIGVERAVAVVDGTAASALPGVHAYNAAWGGAVSGNYLDSTTITRIGTLNPVAVLHQVGSNDYANGVDPATYKTNIQAAITSLKAVITGPCVHILVQPYQRRDVTSPAYPWSAYGDALAQIAAADPGNVAFVDISAPYALLGVTGSDPLALVGSDGIHQTDAGHELMAELIRKALRLPDGRPQNRVLLDSFARPDAAALGAADTGQSWYASTSWTVASGRAVPPSGSAANAFIDSGLADLDVTAVVTFDGTATVGLAFRSADDNNRLGLFLATGALTLFKTDTGSTTALVGASASYSAGTYVLRVVAQGNTLTGYLNGAPLVSYTMTVGEVAKYAALTKVGFRVSSASSTARFGPLVVKAADTDLGRTTRANRTGRGCRIYAVATNQTLTASATAAKITCNTLDYNDDAALFTPDAAGGSSITVLRAGKVLISPTCRFGVAASGERDLIVQVNGTSRGETGTTSGGTVTHCPTFVVPVTAGDVITMVGYVDGANVAIGTAQPYQTGLTVTWLGDTA